MTVRVPLRWQRRISVAVILLALGLLAHDAFAAADTPQMRVQRAIQQTAGRTLELDCTYAARGGAEAVAYPDGNPIVYVKPRWCGQARSFVRRPTVEASKALLILTHEALHIRLWAGARDEVATECRALEEVDDFARLLGASASMAAAVQARARLEHVAAGWPECVA